MGLYIYIIMLTQLCCVFTFFIFTNFEFGLLVMARQGWWFSRDGEGEAREGGDIFLYLYVCVCVC